MTPAERSAIHSYAVAGAFLGVLSGAWLSNRWVGTQDPGVFYALTGLLACPLAGLSWWLISRRWRVAGRGERLFHAVFGWILLLGCAGLMFLGLSVLFAKAGGP